MKKKSYLMIAIVVLLVFSGCAAKSGDLSYAPTMAANEGLNLYRAFGNYDNPANQNSESYLAIADNPEISVAQESMVTLSLKVDTAAYSNIQRYLESGNLPPHDAVRTEELINYFNYDTPMSFGDAPFAVYTEVAPSIFDSGKYIAMIRVKTPDIDKSELPRSNLTFLIDTSGSMDSYDKLPLLKQAFSLLVDTLDENDRVSIVTYAGSAGIVLDSATGDDKVRILDAINNLNAHGSTAGGEGIVTAYALAEKNFIEGGNNRVILATDGDFNVGPSSNNALSKLIQEKRDGGVYLSILGFGTGNIRDDLMETLSKDGNGNYAYINSVQTAKKVLVEELASSLFTVADDVKAQVEFNPENIKSYRLIGYENRQLANEDFENDAKDAGEIGVGTDVVVLFELELQSSTVDKKYQDNVTQEPGEYSNELFEVRIRYKDPGEAESKLETYPVTHEALKENGSTDFNFACTVAAFGHLLRGSEAANGLDAGALIARVNDSLGQDNGGYRWEFLSLLKTYQELCARNGASPTNILY